jgi:hypothetical protein
MADCTGNTKGIHIQQTETPNPSRKQRGRGSPRQTTARVGHAPPPTTPKQQTGRPKPHKPPYMA